MESIVTNFEPYTDQIEKKLNELTLAEKVQLCHASSKFAVKGIARVGIPDMVMSDGPHGVRREISHDSWDPVETEEDYGTYLPTGTAVAATWNREMGKLHGTVLGREARDRGKDVILGPGFNIIRTPLCGRNFEYYSEDPYLISQYVADVVPAIQAEGTAACAKHFACNSQELNRHRVNATPSERALREIYLPGFKTAVDAGVLTVMGAYNLFRGQWCCQNDTLLNEILKNEWGFSGATISDWNGVTKNSYEPAYNGMDIEMGTNKPFDKYYLAEPFQKAIEAGEIEEEILNDKVRRYLFVMYSIGAMGEKANTRPIGERNTQANQAAALKISEEAIVLLKNDNNVLPLRKDVKKVLVVGDNAVAVHHAGGASSAVKALYEITPLEGIKNLLGEQVEVTYLPDPEPADGFSIPTTVLSPADLGAGVNGWKGEIYNQRGWPEGQLPVKEFAVNEIDFAWDKELPVGIEIEDEWRILFSTTLTAPQDGVYRFILHGAADAGLSVNRNPLILRSETNIGSEVVSAAIELKKGEAYDLGLYIMPRLVDSRKRVQLNWILPGDEDGVSLDALMAKATEADVVIYVGGLTHQEDTEGKDKISLMLPGMQNDVIPALAQANDKFVALMLGGSPYAMPWVEQVPAIVQMWFAGMEGGTAVAKVLFGDVVPSGKLPFTFPVKLNDSPAHFLDDYNKDVCYYKEDIFVGYRWFDKREIEPLFCFGHGLSYTSFSYSDLQISMDDEKQVAVSFMLTNDGSVAGSEVAQLYLRDCDCSVKRPLQELKGFQKVYLQAGESKTVTMTLTSVDLSFFHPTKREWTVEAGAFEVYISSSSRDRRLTGSFEYTLN